MGNFVQGKDPTPHKELIEKLMDPAIPKTESEWAAKKEIIKLRAEIKRKDAALRHALHGLENVYMPYADYVIKTKQALSTKEDSDGS